MDSSPGQFTHTVVVPGLVDMARPAFVDVGTKSARRQAFWYRRTFRLDGSIPEKAILKIHKAKYGTKVFLNGQLVGTHLPCFTPALLDVKNHLKGNGQENELVIRVGANRESLPKGVPSGWDFEKYRYYPGIYDSVELILADAPYLINVQTVPDIQAKQVRVVVEVEAADAPQEVVLRAEVVEDKTGIIAGSKTSEPVHLAPRESAKIELTIPLANMHLWSPEDPFLYQLRLKSGGDAVKVRFGMRSFRFDPKTQQAMLNGKPYYMRGTNVCIFRFFEDSVRSDLPWNEKWVRQLHRKYKTMHWNSIRYCIGFPPEKWYDIADEEGFLIQDEFPIWLLQNEAPEYPTAEKIVPEYTEWMRERWNHPCVVIWDAQNESTTDETGKALQAVRHLDLSKRPWDNGWGEPQSPTDCVESHPYWFMKTWLGMKPFRMKELADLPRAPRLKPPQKKHEVPILINEYAWLWLHRDGTPTNVSTSIYANAFAEGSTTDERRQFYARRLAALTEYWRCHREAAGVLHFCGLGFSRPGPWERPKGGATSDNFLDVTTLQFEPYFEEYVRDSFHPVGLMLDFWAEHIPPGATRQLEVYVINDQYNDWKGTVRVQIMRGENIVSTQSKECAVAPLGQKILTVRQTFPKESGDYTIIAELTGKGGKRIRSLRDFKVDSK